MNRLSRLVLPAVVAVALTTGVLLGSAFNVSTLQAQGPTAVVDDQSAILESVYSLANPSVVSIVVRVPASAAINDMMPFVDPRNNQTPDFQYGQGSGFLYDTNGHILTNAHVVESADRIDVTFSNGLTLEAEVVGIASDSDLAVLKVDPALVPAGPLTLADSDVVQVGQRAIAIGNPFGLSNTMTEGIISAVDRSLPQSTFRIPKILQTDAAINPGNSGGPLLNVDGQVIGVNTAIRSGVQQSSGVGFAIPSNIVRLIADELIATGKVTHSYLGITGQTLTTRLNRALELPLDFRGVLVAEVPAGGPAARAGLRGSANETTINDEVYQIGGDIITAVDDQPVRVFEDLLAYLFTKTNPGDTVTLTLLRDGQEMKVDVTLSERPATVSFR
ncbi:MAG: trypsin-like peptidase domain-containing protein [Anaerolineae bacterium]|nr:trypsin-like peptidase domain-containing protein [Anaerolineae bacterium]